jgi:hypothetical protein
MNLQFENHYFPLLPPQFWELKHLTIKQNHNLLVSFLKNFKLVYEKIIFNFFQKSLGRINGFKEISIVFLEEALQKSTDFHNIFYSNYLA